MDTRYIITSSPHIRSGENTQKVMFSVLIALMPALIIGCVFFGWRAFIIALLSVGAAVASEVLFNLCLKRKQTVDDLSACITGLLLAMSLPSTVPLWIPVIGSAFAIIVVKQLFGGIGRNIFNPALTARIMLAIAWPKEMTNWVKPFAYDGVSLIANVDLTKIETTVTPLASMKAGTFDFQNLFNLLWGNIGGCIGETSVILLLAGSVFLMIRRVISWETPVAIILSLGILSFIFPASGTPFVYMLSQLLSGGLVLGAFFMATDYATSPVTKWGKFIFGLCIGILTFLLRRFTGYSEGIGYAIVFMNIFAYTFDKHTKPRRYGKGGAFYGKQGTTEPESGKPDEEQN